MSLSKSKTAKILNIILLIIILQKVKNISKFASIEHIYPTSLTLSNSKILIVNKDGIYIYNSELGDEKNIILFETNNLISDETVNAKTALNQFSSTDGDYILALVNNIMYFLTNEGTLIDKIDYNGIINGKDYNVIPYKKENNDLHYFICYYDGSTDIILYYKFNINTKINTKQNLKNFQPVLSTNSNANEIFTLSCLLMTENSGKIILTCFQTIKYPEEIHSNSFDISNNFQELNEYHTYLSMFSYVIKSSISDSDKSKALVIFSIGTVQWTIFDLNKKNFTELKNLDLPNSYTCKYSVQSNQVFYFKKTQEFGFACATYSCIFIVSNFYKNLTFRGIESYNPDDCYNSNSFSLIFSENKNKYSIITDNAQSSTYGYILDLETNGVVPDSEEKKNETQKENLEKCKISNSESISLNLCIECNIDNEFYEVDYIYNSGYKECYNNETKPKNFYFDSNDKKYKLCHENCETCDNFGSLENNNCLTCAIGYIFKPEIIGTKNCVTKCINSYYYNSFGQYKCTETNQCPEESNLFIKDLNKCTDDCTKEDKYKYQYGGNCLEKCPENTIANNNFICEVINKNSCSLSENDLYNFITAGSIELMAKNYINEFNYTNQHVSLFKNTNYSIVLYKNLECINKLEVDIPQVDFGSCYENVKNSNNIKEDLLIVVLNKNSKNGNPSSTAYCFFNPIQGNKLNAESVCQNDTIKIEENVFSILNDSNIDLESLKFLTNQNINVFNTSHDFYTDICFHFDSPNKKDIALKDRLLLFYPNVTLCDDGCNYKGVNLTSMSSICECKFNDIMHSELLGGNAFINSFMGEITEMISESNLAVLKCYKDIIVKKYFIKCIGAFIILGILFCEIISSIIFWCKDIRETKKYIRHLTKYYVDYLSFNGEKKHNSIFIYNRNQLKNNNSINKKEPPKKKLSLFNKENRNIKVDKSDRQETEENLNRESTKKLKIKKTSSNIIEENQNNILRAKSDCALDSIIINNDAVNNSISPTVSKSNKNIRKSKKNKMNKSNYIISSSKNTLPVTKNNPENKRKKSDDIDIDEYLSPDPNDMDYDDAMRMDKRTFCEFFSDKLMEKQIILNTFFNKDPVRPMSIKIILFLLNIELYFVVNGLFFSENYVSEVYHLTTKDNFFSFFPRSINRFIYTTLVDVVIGMIIECVFIDENKIKKCFLRNGENINDIKSENTNIIKKMKKSYTIFIIICYIVSVISWYYITCFNNVYPNMKIEWIKSSITIMIIMQFLSFLIGLFESILRFLAFKCKSEKLFKVSKMLS